MWHKEMLEKVKGLLSRKLIFGASLGAGLFFMVVGVIFWGGVNTAMEATNTMEFCITCHEMKENIYNDYTKTAHYSNRSGVRATCTDCHVPDPWIHKTIRKIEASRELYHKALGSVNTPEKFDAKRLELAQRVWTAMKKTDSRECRNCHDYSSMNPEDQKRRSRTQHLFGMEQGQTCIDCHKGIVHKPVHEQLSEEQLAKLEKPNPRFIREMPPQWAALQVGDSQPVESDVAAVTDAALEPAPETVVPPEVAAAPQPAAPAAAPAAAPGQAISGQPDWGSIPAQQITLFYTGVASMEWSLNGRDHSGARVYRVAGDRCFDCHEGEEKDFGSAIAAGNKTEPTPIPDKRGYIPMQVQASHDRDNLYMRFEWADAPSHAPAPFASGGKMDPENPMKFALMLATDAPEHAEQAGCWGSCHHDATSMPHAPAGKVVTKYLAESRTEIVTEGDQRGGWDKLKDPAAIEAELKAGHFLDLLRYNSGTRTTEGGYVLAERVMRDPAGTANFQAELKNGTWTVVLKRKLKPGKLGDLDLEPGKIYNIGFAIHDDYADARYHHVSLGFKLGLGNSAAEINAVSK